MRLTNEGETFTLKLSSPITEEEWDIITDVDFDKTDHIYFHTKHGKEVHFYKRRAGQWVPFERREPQYDIGGVKTWAMVYRCSECNFLHSVIEDFWHYAYCPSCGAQMEVKE